MVFLKELSNNIVYFMIFVFFSLFIYYVLPKKARKIALLIISLVFYALCDWKMLFAMMGVILLSWFFGKIIKETKSKKWLIVGCVLLVAFLSFFKYNSFFLYGTNRLLSVFGLSSNLVELMMPLGISYYIFKAISYIVDIYRGKYDDEKNIIVYALYICLFSEILCGPITRYDDYKITVNNLVYNKENFQNGFYLILKGLFMKVIIANRLAPYVSEIFSAPQSFTGIALWMAAFFYSIQLYCDFAGYSFVAVGVTKMFGLHTTINFDRPYFAANIKEFWSRWHISLSSWLRDYVYIPLGGSRCSKLRSKINVLITFLVSGLWHGRGLNFIVWGLIHGVANVCTPKKVILTGFKRAFMILVNFFVVSFGWIFFGTDSLTTALIYIKCMFSNFSISVSAVTSAIVPFTGDNTCVAFFLTVSLFILILAAREIYEEKRKISVLHTASWGWQVFLLTAVLLFGSFGTSGFIYANF